jgi:hypothetical protein
LTIWLLLAFFLFFVLSCFKSSFFFFFVLWWSRKQTGTHTHGHLAKRKAKERNIHHGVSAVKTFRVLRARTNIAHLYPTKTTRSALSSAQPSALFLLWVSLSPPLLVVWLGYTYSDSFFFFFSFPNAPFGFFGIALEWWIGDRQRRTQLLRYAALSFFILFYFF